MTQEGKAQELLISTMNDKVLHSFRVTRSSPLSIALHSVLVIFNKPVHILSDQLFYKLKNQKYKCYHQDCSELLQVFGERSIKSIARSVDSLQQS